MTEKGSKFEIIHHILALIDDHIDTSVLCKLHGDTCENVR